MAGRFTFVRCGFLAVALAGCSTSTSGGDDADGGDGGDTASDALPGRPEIAPPALPVLTPCPSGWVEVPAAAPGEPAVCDPWPDTEPAAPPLLTPCPAGWREVAAVEVEGAATCDPWPEGGGATCAADEAWFPGDSDCGRVGTACPAGEWPDDLPTTGEVLHVRAGGGPGGAGTAAAPFGTIAEAVAAAGSGAVIALGCGRFEEAVALPAGVTLWGACTAETEVACAVPSATTGTLEIGGAGTVVRNLRIGGPCQGIRLAGAGTAVRLEDVVVAGTTRLGLRVADGATMTGRGVVVRDTEAEESDGRFGRGLQATGGAQVELERVVVERNMDLGLAVAGSGTVVRLSDVVVRRTAVRPSDRQLGRGMQVQQGGRLEVARGVVEDNVDAGVYAIDGDSAATLADVVVRGTIARETDGFGGQGLSANGGSRIEVSRGLIAENRGVGAYAEDLGSTLVLADVVVRDTQPFAADDSAGDGLRAVSGARAEVRRAVFAGNRRAGAAAGGVGSTLALEDVRVLDTQSQLGDGLEGYGLVVVSGAAADVRGALLARNRAGGIWVAGGDPGVETRAGIEDVAVRDTRVQEADGWGGYGLIALSGGRVDVARGSFAGNRSTGVLAAEDATLGLSDVVVRGTASAAGEIAEHGEGLQVLEGARVTVARALLEANRDVGLVAAGAEAVLEATDVVVRDTLPREADDRFGVGLAAFAGATATLERVLCDGNRSVGLLAAEPDTSVVVADLVVRDTEAQASDRFFGCGVAVQAGAGLDLTRGFFEGNRDSAVFADGEGVVLALRDVAIRDTLSAEANGRAGFGVVVQLGARGTVERSEVVGCRGAGMFVGGANAMLSLIDVDVRGTLPMECATTACVDEAGGAGIVVFLDAAAEANDFRVDGHALCGVQLARGGVIDLWDGEVSGNPIGVNVQTEGFELSRLQNRVIYRDNERNIDSVGLPVPELPGALPE